MDNRPSPDQPFYKKTWFNLILLVVAVAVIIVGVKIGSQSNTTDTTSGEEDNNTNIPEDGNKKPSNISQSSNPSTDIRRAIMVDTVSKWDDVDEFSLVIDENTRSTYNGDLVVTATANYNGFSSNAEDTLVSYCNKIATAIDLTSHSVAEFDITWTIPAESSSPIGKCHYHSQDGVLVYDDESNGILTNK